jgi:hypothetical protein
MWLLVLPNQVLVMVKINVTRGRDTASVCRYVLQAEKILPPGEKPDISELIVGNMTGASVTELAAEFRLSQRRRPNINVNVAHYSVSFPPGEDVDPQTMKKLAWRLICGMGHSPATQFFAVKHFDEKAKNDVSHFHIVASVIGLDGTVCKSSWDRLQAKKVERDVEQFFRLSEHPIQKKMRRALTTGEYRRRQRSKESTTKERLWEIIDRAAIDQPNYAEFFTRLHENGVTLKIKQDDKTREILGVSYGFEGMAYSGYRLGSQYTYQGIQKHLGVRMVVDSLVKEEEIKLDGVGQVELINSFVPVSIDDLVVQQKVKKVADMER